MKKLYLLLGITLLLTGCAGASELDEAMSLCIEGGVVLGDVDKATSKNMCETDLLEKGEDQFIKDYNNQELRDALDEAR